MYDFRDLKIDQRIRQPDYPTEMVKYGGQYLDMAVPGFRTLYTTGRHDFSRQVNAPDRAGDGATYLSSRLETRKIEVIFYLTADNINDYNDRVNQLKSILSVPNQPILFADDASYYYVGTVTALTFDDPTLSTKGKIEFTLQDPYAHSAVRYLRGTGSLITIADARLTNNPQLPKILTFTSSSYLPNPVISCGSNSIKFNVGVSAGQPVTIDFNRLLVTINRVESMMAVSLDSNLSDFYVQSGSMIKLPATVNYDFRYEVKRL